MNIEQFIAQSIGQWRSMRSGHSIAFKQFEQIVSNIKINLLAPKDPIVMDLIQLSNKQNHMYLSPFQMRWEADSDWLKDDIYQKNSGSTILIPFPKTESQGFFLRSMGYTEPITSISDYSFLNDGTLVLTTKYKNTITEEKIWFISHSVRCRSSVIFTKEKVGILQTSFASEIKSQIK